MISPEDLRTQLEQKLEVGFSPSDDATGEPTYVRVHKGGTDIYMTADQARSVAEQITKKLR